MTRPRGRPRRSGTPAALPVRLGEIHDAVLERARGLGLSGSAHLVRLAREDLDRAARDAEGGAAGRARDFLAARTESDGIAVLVRGLPKAPVCNCADHGGTYPDGSHLAFCPAHNALTCQRCGHAKDARRAHSAAPVRRCGCVEDCRH